METSPLLFVLLGRRATDTILLFCVKERSEYHHQTIPREFSRCFVCMETNLVSFWHVIMKQQWSLP